MPLGDGLLVDLGANYGPRIFAPDNPPPGGRPTRMLVGPVSRGIAPTRQGEFVGATSGFIIDDYDWNVLQPTTTASLSTSAVAAIVSELDWASAHTGIDGQPFTCVLRFSAGYLTPQWLKTSAGSYVAYGRDGTDASWPQAASDPSFRQLPSVSASGAVTFPGGVPKYWTSTFFTAYENLLSLLAASAICSHPALAGITVALPMTQFNEPCVKQYTCDENRANAAAAGWTQALDDAAFLKAFQLHHQYFTPLGLFTESSYNPAESISGTGRRTASADRSVMLMETQKATIGGCTVWANHGWSAGQNDPIYARMRQGMAAAHPTGVGLQTRTLGKHQQALTNGDTQSKVPLTLTAARDLGASWVELPGNCMSTSDNNQRVTMGLLSSLMAGFRANAAAVIAG